MNIDFMKLCLVTHFNAIPSPSYLDLIHDALAGGVTCVQLRYKNLHSSDILPFAHDLKTLTRKFTIPLIVNDHLDLAIEIDADGVHLGQSDISPEEARKRWRHDKIIGWSVETWDQLFAANLSTSIDYIGASAVFKSTSKLDCKTYWGLDGLQKLCEKSRHPVMAIGGIQHENIQEVMACGVSGVAVISAIHNHADPHQAAANLRGNHHV